MSEDKIPMVDDRIQVGEKIYTVIRRNNNHGIWVLHIKDMSINSPIPGWGVIGIMLDHDTWRGCASETFFFKLKEKLENWTTE